LPKKVRRLAIKSALSSKVIDNDIIVLDTLAIATPRTKEIVSIFNNFKVERKALVVTANYDETVALSVRNIPNAKFVSAEGINVLDVLGYDKLIITQDAAKKVEEVFA